VLGNTLGDFFTNSSGHHVLTAVRRLFSIIHLFALRPIPTQGCQMVYFQNKNTILGSFWRALEWKMLAYFVPIWNIYYGYLVYYWWSFGNFVAIWYIFPVLVYCVKKKSGNPVPTLSPWSDQKAMILVFLHLGKKWFETSSEHSVNRRVEVKASMPEKLFLVQSFFSFCWLMFN
jgi:hypothetical protein